MKKLIILITTVMLFAVLILVYLSKVPKKSEMSDIEKPPIVDHFACSDYCPGPQEKYMVKVYHKALKMRRNVVGLEVSRQAIPDGGQQKFV